MDGGRAAAGAVKLEYRDEHGRLQTPKEAYRQLSYKFHGRKPSKSVQEKRDKKHALEDRVAKAGLGDTLLGSAAALHKATEARGAAFITLSRK